MTQLRRLWPFRSSPGVPPSPPAFMAWGKLPVFGDYLGWPSVSPTSAAAARYTEWIRRGWDTACGMCPSVRILPHGVWCCWSDAPESISAQIWHSQDNVPEPMTRIFPFTCFVTESDAGTWPTRLERLLGRWSELDLTRQQLGAMLQPQEFEQICREAGQRAAAPPAAAPSEEADGPPVQTAPPTLRAFGSLVLGTADDEAIRRWFAGTTDFLRQCGEQSNAREQSALLCPVSPGLSILDQILGWVGWISAAAPPQARIRAVLLPHGGPGPGSPPAEHVVICLQELTDIDLLLVTTEAAEYARLKMVPRSLPATRQETEETAAALDLDRPFTNWDGLAGRKAELPKVTEGQTQ